MVAGGKGIPVSLFLFELGPTKGFRALEEHAERLGQLVVLLDESGWLTEARRPGALSRPMLWLRAA